MNQLIQTIKKNDEEFENKIIYGVTPWKDKLIDALLCQLNSEEEALARYEALKFHITQSRIKELEALAEAIKRFKKPNRTFVPGDYILGYNQALFDITQVLKNTIKELKKYEKP